MMIATIIKIVSNQYTVMNTEGKRMLAKASGKVRLQGKPLVGDKVELIFKDDQVMIERFLDRTNVMRRPMIANVDQVLIVMSVKKPDFSSQLVDRFVWLIKQAHIEPVLVVTKYDLLEDSSMMDELLKHYEPFMRVVKTGKTLPTTDLESVLVNKVSVLTGQSGVGKSSLINRIEPSFVLQTQEISRALGRGKHTTRHVELHFVASGWVADTPGFSSMDFSHISMLELKHLVKEFDDYNEACRFRDCMHVDEPDCAVKVAVSKGIIDLDRYRHYLEVRQLIHSGKDS
jgi:ribosome biogenesis GTPase